MFSSQGTSVHGERERTIEGELRGVQEEEIWQGRKWGDI